MTVLTPGRQYELENKAVGSYLITLAPMHRSLYPALLFDLTRPGWYRCAYVGRSAHEEIGIGCWNNPSAAVGPAEVESKVPTTVFPSKP